MKRILLFLLLVVIVIMGYNTYLNYQRFHPPNYHYQVPESIASVEGQEDLRYRYYQAVEELNGYVITQWSDDRIDVRNPGDDDEEVMAAVNEYARKLAKVKFYETQLLSKDKPTPKKTTTSDDAAKKESIRNLFRQESTPRMGDKNAMVYELQRILKAKGDSIAHDGVFREETQEALRAFELKHGLYPDGKLDALTLEYLLKD